MLRYLLALLTFFRKFLKWIFQRVLNRIIWDVGAIQLGAGGKLYTERYWKMILMMNLFGRYLRNYQPFASFYKIEYFWQGEKYTIVSRRPEIYEPFFPIYQVKNPKYIVEAKLIGRRSMDITDVLNRYLGPAGNFHADKFTGITFITWKMLFEIENIDYRDYDTLEIMDNGAMEKKFDIRESFLESVVFRGEIIS